MIEKLICLIKDHNWFSYVSDTTVVPGWHSIWCGRCGAETTIEDEYLRHSS